MRRFVALAGLGTIVAWLALPGSPALACTCDALPLRAQMTAADVVFRGQVQTLTADATEQRVTMKVARVYKGEPHPVVDVRTAASPDACGLQFARDESYLVFARTAASGYTTSLCSGTTDDVSAVERAGVTGHDVVAANMLDVRPSDGRPSRSRSMPIALAGIALSGVFAVHARRFAKLS